MEAAYTVEAGDTVSALAHAFGSSVSDIVACNSLANPNLIRVGQELIIPLPEVDGQLAALEDGSDAEDSFLTTILGELTGLADLSRAQAAFDDDDIIQGIIYSGLGIVALFPLFKIAKVATAGARLGIHTLRVARAERALKTAERANGLARIRHPGNLYEQLAMQSAKSGKTGRVLPIILKDKLLPPGSVKMQHVMRGKSGKKVTVHWVRSKDGVSFDFKIKYSDF
jgi:LysM repeat protein